MAQDWCTLPLDLLATILMKLDTWEDFIYSSVVCREWNCASVLIKHKWKPTATPWLLLAETTQQNPSRLRKIFNLRNNKCYNFSLPETFGTRCLGSAYGWVALICRDFKVQLFNPITKTRILFPSLETMVPYFHGNFDKDNEEDIIWYLKVIIEKLVVLKVPRGEQHEFVIVAYNYKCLFFSKQEDQSWTMIFHEEARLKMVDIIGVDDHVFGMFNDGTIIFWNVMEFYGLEVIKPKEYFPGKPEKFEEFNHGQGKMYLVHCGSDLLMLLRDNKYVKNWETDVDYDETYKTFGFKVYRLDLKDKSWEEIDDLDDVALFVGNNSSMSICEATAKGLQSSIYFTDDKYEFWELPKEFGGHDMGVYNLKSGEILKFYDGGDTPSLFSTATWFIS